jgi:hypothetical protein
MWKKWKKVGAVSLAALGYSPGKGGPAMDKSNDRTVPYTEIKDLPPDCPIYCESQTYRREMPRWLAEGQEGKFVLIKGDEVIGLFEKQEDALAVGRQKYLFEPFLVQQIRSREPVIRLPWLYWSCRT